MFDIDKVCIIGGDIRQVYLGASLAKDGRFVTYYALEKCGDAQPDFADMKIAVSKCDTVILPMPLSRDGKTLCTPLSELNITLDDELAKLLDGRRVFCANSSVLTKTGDYSGCRVFDYLEREELAVLNAVPTAEGAIKTAVELSDRTIHGSRCLIAGFGRIGKLLARDLSALGAHVTVSARKPSDLAWVRACGYKAVNTADIKTSGEYELIFNTIPSMIFDRETLAKTARGAAVIDLASKPGGVDLGACRELRIKATAALSLPGKTAPYAAAEIIKETIYNMAREENP